MVHPQGIQVPPVQQQWFMNGIKKGICSNGHNFVGKIVTTII